MGLTWLLGNSRLNFLCFGYNTLEFSLLYSRHINMQTLHKFIASASMKKIGSLPAQEPGSPKRLEVQPAKRITSDAEVSAAEVSEVKVTKADLNLKPNVAPA